MALKVANNATSTLSSSITNSANTLSIQSADSGKFPVLTAGDWHPATIVDASNNMEIVKVTARSGATLTIVRAQEGTTAKAFAAGAKIEIRITAAAINDMNAATSGAANAASAVQSNLTDYENSNDTRVAAIESEIDAFGNIVSRNLFVSTSAPSGGDNGDIWFQI